MNIVLISSFDDRTPATYLLRAFRENNVNVLAIGTREHKSVNIIRNRTFNLMSILEDQNFTPDLLIYVEGGHDYIFPEDLGEINFPTAWWGIDTHNNYNQHFLISRIFDHSLIAQKSFATKLSQDGIRSVTWFPLAYPASKMPTLNNNKKYDVSYVGSLNWDLYPERKKIFEMVNTKIDRFYFDTASPEDMFNIYSSSKIVINHSLKNDINMRIFESMGAGAFLLTNPIQDNGLEEIIKIGRDFDIYKNLDDLSDKIDFYLQNDGAREEAAKYGQDKILNNHTYNNRVDYILSSGFEKTQHVNVQNVDLLSAFISMKYLHQSVDLFTKIYKDNELGKSEQFIFMIYSILVRPLVSIIELISKTLNWFRKTQ